MNLIVLLPEDFVSANRVRLTGERCRHIRRVLRAGSGDRLRAGLLNGNLGTAVVLPGSAEAVEMEVALAEPPPAPLPLTLVLALPRPKSLRRILQGVTAFGVKRIVLIGTWRVEKSYWGSPTLSAEAIRRELILGLELARDTALPRVELRPLFKPFVEDELPALIEDTLPLVAHPDAARACPRLVDRAVTLAIGPEGGFIDYEVRRFAELGFTPISLGPRRLGVEQAVPALLGRIF